MTDIGPGTKLECIDAAVFAGAPVQLVLGGTYTVREVFDYLPHLGKAGASWVDCSVSLVEILDPAPDLTWGLYRFKPIGGETQLDRLMALEPTKESV